MRIHLRLVLSVLAAVVICVSPESVGAQAPPAAVFAAYNADHFDEAMRLLETHRTRHGPTVSGDFLFGSSLCRMRNAPQAQISRGIDLLQWMVSEWSAREGYKITRRDWDAVQKEIRFCESRLPSVDATSIGRLGSRPLVVSTAPSTDSPGIRFRPVDASMLLKASDLSRTLDLLKTSDELSKVLERLREGTKGTLAIPKQ